MYDGASVMNQNEKKGDSYRRVSLKKELVDAIEVFIHENKEYGYRSIANFVEDAIRRRSEQLKVIPVDLTAE